MKVNKIMDKHAAVAPVPTVTKPAIKLVKEDTAPQSQPTAVDELIFPASDRFKHMLSLIARDNKELYNRIVGME